ncbi:Calx-beta domain-containing protein [Roseobacter sp.]|uniref:Calx-beta domain-containing protein n=1 Tax=Roseobacter sp. TaxID=1907202 RepID=UPI002966123E|nr:Calx-beta domain-containing protein [Roseobacter sp.]MDW3181524.1 Calx-beta domain-containing protein [Roseobacter sp.]
MTIVSGDAAFIAAAAVVDDGPAEVTAEAAPTGAPGIPAGIGISASQAEIVEGDDGAQQVSFTVYRTGDLSEAFGVAYRIGGTADAEDYTGPASGSLEFAPGEASVAVTLDITGDGRVEANETLSVSFEVTSGPTPVLISSTASVTIVNDDLAPVVPPLNPIEGTGGSDLVHGTDGADLINGLGGRFDKLFGLDGADVFVFGGEAQDGARDRDIIMDYEVGIDSILLTDGATVGAIRDTNAGAVIFLEGDGDAIYVRGADIDPDTLTIVTDDLPSAERRKGVSLCLSELSFTLLQ